MLQVQDTVKKLFDSVTDVEKKYIEKWLLIQAKKDVLVKQVRTVELVRHEMVSNIVSSF